MAFDDNIILVDMPAGTGDVALTVMQSIPISGLVRVSVPQDLVSMIVSKAVNMTRKMDIKFLGEADLQLLGKLPMLSTICNL